MTLEILIICITIFQMYRIHKENSCHHTWKVIDTTDFSISGFHAYRKYYMTCTKCGNVKNKKV